MNKGKDNDNKEGKDKCEYIEREKELEDCATVEQNDNPSKEERKYKDLESKYSYLYADFENYKRRKNKEISDLLTYAHSDFVLSILPVLDDLERALSFVDPATNEWLVSVVSKFTRVLADNGVKKIETKKGDAYNEEFHNAVATQNVADGGTKDDEPKIKDIIRNGYVLNGKVVRHVDVIV